jgi:steroid 5-alpha reductase family enzyme
VLSYSALMGIAAWGMWRAKYWAVLGMQAILGILIVLFSVFLFEASNVQSALICVAVIGPAGALFYFLVKAMARIQMPQRPGA